MANSRIELSGKDREALEQRTTAGKSAARVVRRAQILLLSDKGWKLGPIAEATNASEPTVKRVRRAYRKWGLERALYEQTRSGRPVVFGLRARKKVIALACSPPPEGYARWTCALLAEHCDLEPRPSKNTVHMILQKDGIKPWREKNVVRSRARRGLPRGDGQGVGGLRTAS